MILAINKMVISKEWYHDPLLKNKYFSTVPMILADKNIIPPKQWMHNVNI